MLGLMAFAVFVPWLGACSDDAKFRLPKLGSVESLSVGSAAPVAELRTVTAADLVGPQGQCAGGGQDAAAPRGGIALQMTECEVVGRAGTPQNVELGTNERGERAVTLTYANGSRPGIYRFTGGRLTAIERGQEPPPPEPPKAKKPPAKKPKPA
jgi:hypothetical protein